MAMDPRTGEVIDPFGGRDDLDASVVRAVGDANERIGEDGLRIMRAFRFLDALDSFTGPKPSFSPDSRTEIESVHKIKD